MKSYTDLEQSHKLAEILPLESADMWYGNEDPHKITVGKWNNNKHDEDDIPCWSLAALLDVVNIGNFVTLYYDYNAWHLKVDTSGSDNRIAYSVIYADNQIDACVEMILKLRNFGIM